MNDKADYHGNCIHSFDEDGQSLIPLFNDVSEFAFAEEEAMKIDFYKFIEITKLSRKELDNFYHESNIYLYHDSSNSAFIYNQNSDIHQIFKINNTSISMTNSPLDKIKNIEEKIKQNKDDGGLTLFHSGDSSRDEDLKYGIEPQFGDWLSEVLSGAADPEDELFEEISENEQNHTCYFSEDPSWVTIKAQRAAKPDSMLMDTTLEDVINHGQLCIILVEHDEDNEEFKRAGSRNDDYVEKSTYLFNDNIADYELPFGVERGDIYSHDCIEPDFTLTGIELAGFLARNYPKANIMKGKMQEIFEQYPEFDNTDEKLTQDIAKLIEKEVKDTPKKTARPRL